MIARIAEEDNILSLSLPAVLSKVLGTESSLLACWCKSEPSHIGLNSSRLLLLSRMSL
jgi:hypothetical protein